MTTTKEHFYNIKCALINQSNRGPVVFIVMGMVQNFNVKRGRLK